MDFERLKALADSIKTHGVVQPVIVRPKDSDRYELIAGERRWRAARLAGLAEIPVVVRELDDRAALASANLALRLPTYSDCWNSNQESKKCWPQAGSKWVMPELYWG